MPPSTRALAAFYLLSFVKSETEQEEETLRQLVRLAGSSHYVAQHVLGTLNCLLEPITFSEYIDRMDFANDVANDIASLSPCACTNPEREWFEDDDVTVCIQCGGHA